MHDDNEDIFSTPSDAGPIPVPPLMPRATVLARLAMEAAALGSTKSDEWRNAADVPQRVTFRVGPKNVEIVLVWEPGETIELARCFARAIHAIPPPSKTGGVPQIMGGGAPFMIRVGSNIPVHAGLFPTESERG